MGYKCTREVLSWADVSGADLMVLMVIADHAHNETRLGFPSRKRIAHMARITERSVTRCLTKLARFGLIARVIGPNGKLNYLLATADRMRKLFPELAEQFSNIGKKKRDEERFQADLKAAREALENPDGAPDDPEESVPDDHDCTEESANDCSVSERAEEATTGDDADLNRRLPSRTNSQENGHRMIPPLPLDTTLRFVSTGRTPIGGEEEDRGDHSGSQQFREGSTGDLFCESVVTDRQDFDMVQPNRKTGRDELSMAVEAYNHAAERQGWPKVAKLTTTRRKKLRQRLGDAGGIDGWMEALRKAASSGFCNGSNNRGWVVGFDFLLRESSFVKLMEGFYDDRKSVSRFEAEAKDAGDEAVENHLSKMAGVDAPRLGNGGSETGLIGREFTDDELMNDPSF